MSWPYPAPAHVNQQHSLPSFGQLLKALDQEYGALSTDNWRRGFLPLQSEQLVSYRHEASAFSTQTGVDSLKRKLEADDQSRQHDSTHVERCSTDSQRGVVKRIWDGEGYSSDTRPGVSPSSPASPLKKQRKDRNQPMNPLYTRDGNPRKRLAQACERCRAQKIKCRLRDSSCVLCVSHGVQCKFAIQRKSSHDLTQNHRKQLASSGRSTWSPSVEWPVKPNLTSQSDMIDADSPPSIRAANSPAREDDRVRAGPGDVEKHQPRLKAPNSPLKPPVVVQTRHVPVVDDLSVDLDPFLFDAVLTKHYVEQFFIHVNRSPFLIIPRASFMLWLDCPTKTNTEKMLLYAVMAAGAVFSKHEDGSVHRMMFTRIAEDGLRKSATWFQVAVVHTLLILDCIYSFTTDVLKASDYSNSAIRCAYGLQLNYEVTYRKVNSDCRYVTNGQVAEYHRRAYWLAYIRNSIWSMTVRTPGATVRSCGSLRLPCLDSVYEVDEDSAVALTSFGPAQDLYCILDRSSSQQYSSMALMVQVTALARSAEKTAPPAGTPISEYGEMISKNAVATDEKLRAWHCRQVESPRSFIGEVPAELLVVDRSISLLVNGQLQKDALSPISAKRHFLQTRTAATDLLQRFDMYQKHGELPEDLAVDAFTICAVFMAFDTITAAGDLSEVLDRRDKKESGHLTFISLVTLAITVTSIMAQYSGLARTQLNAMKARVSAILAQSNTTTAWRKRGFYFTRTLCTSLPTPHHLVYAMSPGEVADALGLGLGCNKDDMLEIKMQVDE